MARDSKIEVAAVNLRIPKRKSRDYTALIVDLLTQHRGYKIYGDNHLAITWFDPKRHLGILSKYTEIALDQNWFDVEKFDAATPEDIGKISIPQVAATSSQLDEISQKTERLLESGTALLREFVAREVETITVESPGIASTASVAPPSADARYDGIRDVWDELATKLRSALGNASDFDGRQIGRFAYRLAHGNRKIKITNETAEAIAALHSQFKSFARLYATREQWLTEDVYENFVNAVREAISKLPA